MRQLALTEPMIAFELVCHMLTWFAPDTDVAEVMLDESAISTVASPLILMSAAPVAIATRAGSMRTKMPSGTAVDVRTGKPAHVPPLLPMSGRAALLRRAACQGFTKIQAFDTSPWNVSPQSKRDSDGESM